MKVTPLLLWTALWPKWQNLWIVGGCWLIDVKCDKQNNEKVSKQNTSNPHPNQSDQLSQPISMLKPLFTKDAKDN